MAAQGSGGELAAALGQMGTSEWSKQETCYLTLLKLLDNVLSHPGEDKYRRLKTGNAALKAKVFDVQGARNFLLAAGFVEEEGGELLAAPASLRPESLAAAREALQKHANDAKMHELRVERDARITKAKAEDAKIDHLKAKAHLTPEEMEELRKNIERDRREFEAERELNPTRESHAADLKFGAKEGDTSFLKKSGGG
mmetsp:Transcript_27811/g.65545  ORF Transcript_27811/g.65545 Transcript_27811/m.65545 type:complete len:198 (-) Transcript_27811:215-808(-)